MRALIVGAGAVGQVYGAHLQAGGARVDAWVRPRHRARTAEGFDLFEVRGRADRFLRRFEPVEVLTEASALPARRYDQVWVCVPSGGLQDPELQRALALSGDATVVCLQPGLFSGDALRAQVPAHRLVFGVIAFEAWSAPLAGSSWPEEQRTGPGIAYFFPPIGGSSFSGPECRCRSVVDALRMGRCPALAVPDARAALQVSSSLLMPQVAGLELAGWSFARYRGSPEAALAARASRQALAISAAQTGRSTPFFAPLLRPLAVDVALTLAPRLVPFDLETFLRVHFEKVGEQTRALFGELVEGAEQHGLPSTALREMLERLTRSAPASERARAARQESLV